MTLDEFEALCKKATREWISGYMPVAEHNHWRSVGPVTFGMEQAVCDAAFTDAARNMAPGIIEALTAAQHALRALDSGQAVISCSALHKWLSDTFTKLEKP